MARKMCARHFFTDVARMLHIYSLGELKANSNCLKAMQPGVVKCKLCDSAYCGTMYLFSVQVLLILLVCAPFVNLSK